MSTTIRATPQMHRLLGPSVPAWTQSINNFLPWRVSLDSLGFMLQNAQKYGGFYAIWFGDQPIYVVSDPTLVREILVERAREFHKADLVKTAVGAFAGNGLFTNEDDFWRRQRKLAQPAFHHKRIAAYGETMVQRTLAMLATWQDGSTLDIAHEMMKLTLDIVNKTLFNVDVRAQADHIGDLMAVILTAADDRINNYNPIWGRLFRTKKRREAAATQEFFTIIDGIIAEHRRDGEDTGDLLSMLMAARDDEGNFMSEQQLRDEVITLFVAGHETTANALAWALYLVSKHPVVEAKLLAEVARLHGKTPSIEDLAQLPYSEQVVKEAMRLYPPAGSITRQPIHDIELAGYPIAQGSMITLATYVMHRDPTLYPEPECFDPERFLPENESKRPRLAYLPFGGGPRVCIGNSFAMMEARLVLATILQQASLLPPAKRVRAEQMFTLRPQGGLKMKVQMKAKKQ